MAGGCCSGEAGYRYPDCRAVLLVCELFMAWKGSVPEMFSRNRGRSELEYFKLPFLLPPISPLSVTLCKQKTYEEERLLKHIAKIAEN